MKKTDSAPPVQITVATVHLESASYNVSIVLSCLLEDLQARGCACCVRAITTCPNNLTSQTKRRVQQLGNIFHDLAM